MTGFTCSGSHRVRRAGIPGQPASPDPTIPETSDPPTIMSQNTNAAEDAFVAVAREGAIADGESAVFPVNGRMVAVFHEQGTYYAIDDFCPHMGASLAGGHFERGEVVCPWHAWCFSLRDGTWNENPKVKVACFDVRVRDGEIQVRVPNDA